MTALNLLNPIKIGALELKNRVVMAPLTRCRAPGRIPNELMATYYRQRSGVGLILSEATSVDPMGVGYPDTPGIWTTEQANGWKQVTDAVHEEGSLIVCQLWHVGRISHSLYLNGEKPVAPSAIKPDGHVSLVRPITEFEEPRALALEEIQGIVDQYRNGAVLAKEAGFDGIEIHGANGYLIDQFLHTKSNQRTDRYGGSIENRVRLLLEITDACIDVWGADRVGVHIAPKGDSHDVGSDDLLELFGYVAEELGKRQIAFICARESYDGSEMGPELKRKFGGVYIANQEFTRSSAEAVVSKGTADAVAFGKKIISNPDLVDRFRQNADLTEADVNTFFEKGSKGYTDYPKLGE